MEISALKALKGPELCAVQAAAGDLLSQNRDGLVISELALQAGLAGRFFGA